jgi:hypothetical protein
MSALYLLALPAAITVGAIAGLVLSPHCARRPRGYR